MGREIYLDENSLDFEINAVKYAAEQLEADVKVPVTGGNMPSFEKMIRTYGNLAKSVKSCRNMSRAVADNIRNAAESVKRTDRNIFR